MTRIDTEVDADGTCQLCGKKDVTCRRCHGSMSSERCWHTGNGHYCVGCAQEMGWE